MKEDLKHIEAFEKYLSLGGKPTEENCRKVSEEFHITERTFWNWYKGLNWKGRVEQRNIENAKKLAAKTDKTIVNTKADYRAEIKQQLNILKAILNKVIKDFKDDNIIDVGNTGDLKDIINSYEKLCKLDLLMMGEATEKSKLDVDWGNIDDGQLDRFINVLTKAKINDGADRKEEKGDWKRPLAISKNPVSQI